MALHLGLYGAEQIRLSGLKKRDTGNWGWEWEVDMGGNRRRRGGGEYDQNALYEILKELINNTNLRFHPSPPSKCKYHI